MLTCTKRSEDSYDLTWSNRASLGDLTRGVDGYFYWWPSVGEGSWDQHTLRAIAAALERLNHDWDAQVKRECGHEPV